MLCAFCVVCSAYSTKQSRNLLNMALTEFLFYSNYEVQSRNPNILFMPYRGRIFEKCYKQQIRPNLKKITWSVQKVTQTRKWGGLHSTPLWSLPLRHNSIWKCFADLQNKIRAFFNIFVRYLFCPWLANNLIWVPMGYLKKLSLFRQ